MRRKSPIHKRTKKEMLHLAGRNMKMNKVLHSIACCDTPSQLKTVIEKAETRLKAVESEMQTRALEATWARIRLWKTGDALIVMSKAHRRSLPDPGVRLELKHTHPVRKTITVRLPQGILTTITLHEALELDLLRDKPEALLGNDVEQRREQMESLRRLHPGMLHNQEGDTPE